MTETAASLPQGRHRICLEDRASLSVTGVEEVERFDDTVIVLATVCGTVTLRGSDLHMEQFSTNGGEVRVTGTVDALAYSAPTEKRGFFARLLG